MLGDRLTRHVYSAHDLQIDIQIMPFSDEQYAGYPGLVNGSELRTTAQMLPEIVMMSELSKLLASEEDGTKPCETAGFVRLIGVSVVRGWIK